MLKNSLKTLHLHIFTPKLPSEIDISEIIFTRLSLFLYLFVFRFAEGLSISVSHQCHIIKIHGDNLFLGSRSYPRSWPLSHQSHYNLTLNYDLKKFNFFFCLLERSGTSSYHMLLFHFFSSLYIKMEYFLWVKNLYFC